MAKTKTALKTKEVGTVSTLPRRRFIRVGTVLNTKSGKPALKLGNDYGDEQYHYSVSLVVRDSSGEIVAEQTDGFMNFYDPRNNAKRAGNIPDSVLYEVSIGLNE